MDNQKDAAEWIAELVADMKKMAERAGLRELAYLLSMAELEAQQQHKKAIRSQALQ